MGALRLVVIVVAVSGCTTGSKVASPSASSSWSKVDAPSATASPRGLSTWLPSARNGELDTIDGVPLVSVDGIALLVDGLRVGDVSTAVSRGRSTRLAAIFEALRSRREAWLTTHPGEPWPGVVAYRFHPEVSAAVVKSVVLTSGYAACPNGSFLVEVRDVGRARVGRLAVDPLMVAEPEDRVFTVHVKKDAFVVAWKETKSTGRTRTIRASSSPSSARSSPSDALDASVLAAISTLESELDVMWQSAGLHRAATDKRFDQVIVHVDDDVPYKVVVAVVDALHGPRRSMQVGRHEERVPALNVNLASD
jgi:hypothetical protein